MNVERAKLGNLLCRLAEEWRRWIAELTNPARATAVQGPAEKAEFAALIEEANREFVLTTKVLLRYLEDPGASERYRGGGIPYGWQVNDTGELVEHPEQHAVVQQIIDLRRAGRSQRGIAAALRTEGIEISRSAIQRILDQPGVWRMLKVDRRTAAAIARAKKLRPIFAQLGSLSAWSAAKGLNRRRIRTPTGSRWHANTVSRVRLRIAGM